MSKRRLSTKVRLPEYVSPRLKWRKLIYDVVMKKFEESGISYTKNDKLELNVTLYLNNPGILSHDVDNRLKDIMDALQGRIGGSKKIQKFRPLIPNDNQIYRVIMEKLLPPRQSHGLGHLVIRKY